jgi:2-oxoglutarate/2-oxoacid ferredoxin oxidoreductase subunit beta
MIPREPITAEYGPGTVREVAQHDGSIIRLRKLEDGYDPTDRLGAMSYLAERQAAGELVTGLLYLDPDPQDLHAYLDTVETPLNALRDEELVPGNAVLAKVNASLR